MSASGIMPPSLIVGALARRGGGRGSSRLRGIPRADPDRRVLWSGRPSLWSVNVILSWVLYGAVGHLAHGDAGDPHRVFGGTNTASLTTAWTGGVLERQPLVEGVVGDEDRGSSPAIDQRDHGAAGMPSSGRRPADAGAGSWPSPDQPAQRASTPGGGAVLSTLVDWLPRVPDQLCPRVGLVAGLALARVLVRVCHADRAPGSRSGTAAARRCTSAARSHEPVRRPRSVRWRSCAPRCRSCCTRAGRPGIAGSRRGRRTPTRRRWRGRWFRAA